jgi:predicted PurR-regulated permease PerM
VTLRVSGWSLVRAALLVAAGLVVLRVAGAASTVLWWLAIATAAAAVGHPAVTWLRRWLPAWAAIIAVLVAGIALVGLVGYRGVAELTTQFEALRNSALDAARSIQGSRQFGQVAAEFGLVDKTTRFFGNLPVVMGGSGGDGAAAAAVQSASSIGSALFAIATFAVLMLIFGVRFVQAGLAQIDDTVARRQVAGLVVTAYHDSYRYVWLMALRAVVAGVVGGVACLLLGLDTPTVLGVGFALLSLIPGLGIVLATVPVVVLLAIASPPTAVIVGIVALLAQALDVVFVQNRIDASSVEVGPTPTLVAGLVGLQLYGFGGLLVGLAVAVYTLAVLRRLADTHDEVLTAMRQLVREDVTVAVPEGATVVVEPGTDVVVEDDVDP